MKTLNMATYQAGIKTATCVSNQTTIATAFIHTIATGAQTLLTALTQQNVNSALNALI
jgi:hypothetical protein